MITRFIEKCITVGNRGGTGLLHRCEVHRDLYLWQKVGERWLPPTKIYLFEAEREVKEQNIEAIDTCVELINSRYTNCCWLDDHGEIHGPRWWIETLRGEREHKLTPLKERLEMLIS